MTWYASFLVVWCGVVAFQLCCIAISVFVCSCFMLMMVYACIRWRSCGAPRREKASTWTTWRMSCCRCGAIESPPLSLSLCVCVCVLPSLSPSLLHTCTRTIHSLRLYHKITFGNRPCLFWLPVFIGSMSEWVCVCVFERVRERERRDRKNHPRNAFGHFFYASAWSGLPFH